jgi:hypothetical protein
MHVYPRSRGRVLRLIGEDLESAVEFIADKHRHALVALSKGAKP